MACSEAKLKNKKQEISMGQVDASSLSLFGLFLDPEGGGDIFLRNVG